MLYEAVFQPTHKSDYSPNTLKLEGKRIPLHGTSIAAAGPFKGMECFYIPKTTTGLIPVRDLKDLKAVPFVQWEEIFNKLDIAE